MIRVICDKCGVDCCRVAYHVAIQPIHNPTPIYCTDLGNLQITDDNTQIRFCLCQDCYRSLGLPNVYIAADRHKLIFRNEAELPEEVRQ